MLGIRTNDKKRENVITHKICKTRTKRPINYSIDIHLQYISWTHFVPQSLPSAINIGKFEFPFKYESERKRVCSKNELKCNLQIYFIKFSNAHFRREYLVQTHIIETERESENLPSRKNRMMYSQISCSNIIYAHFPHSMHIRAEEKNCRKFNR